MCFGVLGFKVRGCVVWELGFSIADIFSCYKMCQQHLCFASRSHKLATVSRDFIWEDNPICSTVCSSPYSTLKVVACGWLLASKLRLTELRITGEFPLNVDLRNPGTLKRSSEFDEPHLPNEHSSTQNNKGYNRNPQTPEHVICSIYIHTTF